MAKICEFARVKFIKNGLRKSCASYWVKMVGAKEASRILGNSESMLFNNYANTTIKIAEAKRFEGLMPD